ncbi:ras-related protein Rab-25 [Platysternon megacephalum]|uniref:Ras-related protein Rab-25 n=1 Tax=Platysternon megacephalum TaxID=55544 RepID=A0A4D9DGH5_9SAUR|nr:ras-related protein Rab-25 [Platysternon megacephalum]
MVLNGDIIFRAGILMKKPANAIWFLDLAMTDLIFPCILSFQMSCAWPSTHDLFSWWLCELSSVVTSLHMFSSTFLLMVINVDGCLSLACPRWARNHRTSRLASCSGHLPLGYSLRHPDLWHGLMHYSDVVNPGSFSYFYYESRLLVGGKCEVKRRYLSIPGWVPSPISFHHHWLCRSSCQIEGIKPVCLCHQAPPCLGLDLFLSWTLCHVFSFLQLFVQASPLEKRGSLASGSIFAYGLVSLKTCLNTLFCLCLGREFRAPQRCPQPNGRQIGIGTSAIGE